jgi:hypothetical protein
VAVPADWVGERVGGAGGGTRNAADPTSVPEKGPGTPPCEDRPRPAQPYTPPRPVVRPRTVHPSCSGAPARGTSIPREKMLKSRTGAPKEGGGNAGQRWGAFVRALPLFHCKRQPRWAVEGSPLLLVEVRGARNLGGAGRSSPRDVGGRADCRAFVVHTAVEPG